MYELTIAERAHLGALAQRQADLAALPVMQVRRAIDRFCPAASVS